MGNNRISVEAMMKGRTPLVAQAEQLLLLKIRLHDLCEEWRKTQLTDAYMSGVRFHEAQGKEDGLCQAADDLANLQEEFE
jgi:hypothetical protein